MAPGLVNSRRPARLGLLLVLAVWLLAAAGCRDQNAIEQARRRGAEAGRRDGQSAGDADGKDAAYEPAKDAAYDAKLKELYDSNEFRRRRAYTLAVLGVAFLSGFGLQYGALYLLRRRKILFDIDRVVLPRHDTRVDLAGLLGRREPRDAAAPKLLDAPPLDPSDPTREL